MGIIATMLFVGTLIIVGTVFFPDAEQNELISSINLTYYDRFFDKNKVMDVYVTLAKTDYEDMMENPFKEEYKIANVIVDGKKVDNVGFRVKGNSSLNMVARTDSVRFSFKVDFDQYISGQNLEGLTKLNLNNSVSDPSYMREYLSYSLLNEMGISTPGYCYANVYINGELMGIYLAVEAIEEPFLERYFGSNYGTLYKPEGEGSDLLYIDDQIESYSGIGLVTERKNGSDAALLAMIKSLNEGRDLEKYLDVDEILRYFAVNTVLVNMDSYQGNSKHNYYLYEEDGVFSILPWDYNMSFGGFNKGGGPQDLTTLYIDQPVSGALLEERPLIAKLLEVEEYKELYHKYIEEFITGSFTMEKMSEEIDRIATMIRPYLEIDPTKFYTMEQIEQAITTGSSEQSLVGDRVEGMKSELLGEAATDNRVGIEKQSRDNRGMMKEENIIGLIDFINARISNVAKQISGELPSEGELTQSQDDKWRARNRLKGPPPDLSGGGQGRLGPPPKDGGQFPPKMGKFPEEGGDSSEISEDYYLYIVGGSLLLLLVVIGVLFKKKTKYSI